MRYFLVALLLSGCCATETIREPGPVQYRDRLVLQPIPENLTAPLPVAEGPPSQCFEVASARREQLNVCNADRKTLRDRSSDDHSDRRPD